MDSLRPPPLRGIDNNRSTFTYTSIVKRLPAIIDQTIQDNQKNNKNNNNAATTTTSGESGEDPSPSFVLSPDEIEELVQIKKEIIDEREGKIVFIEREDRESEDSLEDWRRWKEYTKPHVGMSWIEVRYPFYWVLYYSIIVYLLYEVHYSINLLNNNCLYIIIYGPYIFLFMVVSLGSLVLR